MKFGKVMILGLVVMALTAFAVGTSYAVVDQTGSVLAEATVTADTMLGVQAKNRSDNANAASVAFPTISGGVNGKLSNQYVEIAVASNYNPWELEVYTNNFPASTPDPATHGYQYGGMLNTSDDKLRTPLVWQCYNNVNTGVTDPPSALTNWTYVKDKKDLNIPTEPGDQSWTAAHNEGYTNIAYGGPDYLNVVEPGTTGVAGSSPIRFYPAGMFGSASAGSYSSNIYFDLYHE